MSRPSSPILVSSCDSTPSPSSSSDAENVEMNRRIRLHRLRTSHTRITPSPPSSSPDERTNDGALGFVIRASRTSRRMTTTTVTLTAAQIRQNAMEDAHEYQDERIDELTDELGAAYSRTFMHAAMISHWANMFEEPVSAMLVNFHATPSIAIPALANIAPPPVFPLVSGSGSALIDPIPSSSIEPALEYPSSDDDWEVQSVDDSSALPVPPPHHHIHPEVLDHLHTLHVATPAPPLHDLGPNREPITPTDPVPSMPSSPPQFLQADPLEAAPPFDQIVNALVQRDVDAQVACIAQEEEDEARTPSPTGPQPGVHPGPGWYKNFEEVAVNYVFLIPTDAPQRYEIAPYVMIDWNTTSPELLGTWGCNCPVHAKHLHARADEFPRPALDRRQEFFFADHQTHTEGVDWALTQEGDDTLRAEVIRHRAALGAVVRRARQVVDLHEQLVDDRFVLNESTCCLARANTYRRLRRRITNTLTATTSTLSTRHINRIQEAVDSPWNWTDDKLSDQCLWCKREGHKVENCALIHVCALCRASGHLEETCFQPHSRCVSFQPCLVPLLH